MSIPSRKSTPSPFCTSLSLNLDENAMNTTSHEFHEIKVPQQPTVDQDNDFWETYVQEAGKFDAELLENWNEALSSLLLFAALFSAINTAFIIEFQKGLQSDPIQTTNNLLRLIIKRMNDSLELSEADLNQSWKADPNALRLNAIFFASLSFSLIASFGAILGKEMLSEYKVSGALNSMAERGQIRQIKFDALRKYRFRVLMHLLPTLLQISLALFLVGIIDFLWQMEVGVAMVMFVPVVVGFIAYIISLYIALRHPHSPFQTSISKAIKSLLSSIRSFGSSIKDRCNTPWGLQRGSKWHNIPIKALIREEFRVVPLHWRGLVSGFRKAGAYLCKVARRSSPSMKEGDDEVKAACVSWLMVQAGDSKVRLRALQVIPLLPSDILLPHFKRRMNIERFTTLYNSNLTRRPGQIKFEPDEEQTQAAIAAGTSLYHIFKSIDEDDISLSLDLKLQCDPGLFDIVEDPDRFHELDPLLIAVIHCIQSLVGVDQWDLNLLQQLLQSCTSSPLIIKPNPVALPLHQENTSHVSSATLNDMAMVALLLDSILFCASRRCIDDPSRSNISKYGDHFEGMINLIADILKRRQSITLASHAAVVVAGIQWYKAVDEVCPRKLKKFESNNITRERIRSAWFAVDKSAQFFDNVAMVFKMTGGECSPATMKFYLTLMPLVERYHPESTSVTWKNIQVWRQWWATTVQIIPGILRIFLQANQRDQPKSAMIALRIISQLLPDDWMEGTALQQYGPVPQLRHISPHDSESGAAMVYLIGTFLDTPILQQCKATREAAAEVIGWVIALDQHHQETGLPGPSGDSTGFPTTIIDPNGIYERSTSIPSFLLSIVVDQNANKILRLFLQHRFDFLLNLHISQDELLSVVQLEALVMSLTHIHEFPYVCDSSDIPKEPPKTVYSIRGIMDRIADGSSEAIWPTSFVAAGIVKPRTSATYPCRTVLKLIADDDILVKDDETRLLWMGSAITIAWKTFVKSFSPSAKHISAIFSNDAISMVLSSYGSALKTSIPVDFRLFHDYLYAAQKARDLPNQLQQQAEDARVYLASVS